MSGAAETLRIGDVLEEFKETFGASTDDAPVLTLTEHNGFVPQEERFNKRLATTDVSRYKVIRHEDFAFNPYLLWAGALAQNDRFDVGVISPLYPTFRVRDGFDSSYLRHILLSPSMVQKFDTIAFGSVPRRKRSSVKDFLNLQLPAVPPLPNNAVSPPSSTRSQVSAQELTRHRNFSMRSSSRSFVDDSPLQRGSPLGDLVTVQSGSTPSRKQPHYYGGSTPWIKTGEVSGVISETEEHVTEAGIEASSLRIFPPGSVVIAMYGQGKTRGQSGLLAIPQRRTRPVQSFLLTAISSPSFFTRNSRSAMTGFAP
ncbi:hypothetical protein [Nesterenkonia pannonica]|uniref:hypothetical protein n=1 Tax=Nesterenkonia pannonica TaxID=1548602 RepID=UPI00216430B4|nr:hypothetical protein [Nesterenkonia pannonica]